MCDFKEEYKDEEYKRREAIVKENQKWLDEYEQGFWIGRTEMKIERDRETALKMLSDGLGLDLIAKYTGITYRRDRSP
jgi:hypothetical protein